MEILKAPHLPGWEKHFYEINKEWLEQHFSMTPADHEQLSQPMRILDSGGHILFISIDARVAGALALVPDGLGNVELAKMGVLKAFRGRGLGRALLKAGIQEAKDHFDGTLYLETVGSLLPAIHLYETEGFKRVGEERQHPRFGRTTFRMDHIG